MKRLALLLCISLAGCGTAPIVPDEPLECHHEPLDLNGVLLPPALNFQELQKLEAVDGKVELDAGDLAVLHADIQQIDRYLRDLRETWRKLGATVKEHNAAYAPKPKKDSAKESAKSWWKFW